MGKNTASKAKAAAKAKVTPKAAATAPLKSNAPKVRVRMFRQGLGDCFLLTFDVDGTPRHMLIDCGTLGNKSTTVKMPDIAAHIFETIDAGNPGSGKLDVVIATHEHQDHLSGFNNNEMKKLAGRVNHAWLAWTENPKDVDAKKIVKYKQDLGKALALFADAAPSTEAGLHVKDLLGFAGDVTLGADKFAETVDAAMQFVRKGLGAETKYCNPGELIEPSWLPGFRIYVLGPPRDETTLKDLGEHGSGELYGMASAIKAAALMHLAGDRDDDQRAQIREEFPFDRRYHVRDEQVYKSWYPNYFASEEEWRAIDEDWMNLASDLALQLDNMTNNTSLAIAIERVADGKVLFFPADAQQGSWLSWHDSSMKWTIPQVSGPPREVTVKDLLARTVFYKVGHHCSHNATARGKGLEMMEKEAELTAFIPVDRAIALTRNPKGSWQMPALLLYRRLLEKCNGRVVRSDLGWARKPSGDSAKTTEKDFKDLAQDVEWTAWGNAQLAATHIDATKELYIEYLLK